MLTEKIRKKIIDSRSGFTLTEVLASLIIMTLIGTIMAGGLPLVIKTYREIVQQSDADVLLSTAVTEIRNELSVATNVEVSSDGKSVDYRNSDSGAVSRLSVGTDGITLTRFKGKDTGTENKNNYSSRPLVSQKAATENLHVSFDTIELSKEGVITVKGIKVLDNNNEEVCSQESYVIRNFAAK